MSKSRITAVIFLVIGVTTGAVDIINYAIGGPLHQYISESTLLSIQAFTAIVSNFLPRLRTIASFFGVDPYGTDNHAQEK